MKLNKKGFMLAEVTVVATLAATVMLALYASSVKTIEAYKQRENYYDVDTIYATGYIYNYIIDSGKITSLIKNVSTYKELKGTTDCEKSCNEIVNTYGVEHAYLVKPTAIDTLKDYVSNKTFINYIENYVKNNISNNRPILIVERKVQNVNDNSKDIYYYYSAEV